jgi:DNA-binding transcriptional regulator YhcF (GntR family)
VGAAYRQLAGESWIDLRHGRGATVVERRLPAAPQAENVREFRDRLRSLVAQMRSAGVPAGRIAAELRSLAAEL